MGKKISLRYVLLLSTLIFSISSKGCLKKDIDPNLENDISSMSHINQAYSEADILNKPNKSTKSNSSSSKKNPTVNSEITLNVRGISISLGEEEKSILHKLGKPNRIVSTEYDFNYYVYNNDYSKLLFVAIRDSEVVGFYTDSIDFNFMGISPQSDLNLVNKILKKDFTMDFILTHNTHSYSLEIFMDEVGTNYVTGISLLTADIKENKSMDEITNHIELLVFDLTNSIRARNGLSTLSWSSTAANAARKHSTDMAINSYFSHYDKYNKGPSDRLNEEGITFQYLGENIIAGYGTAIISTHAWFNSPDHRENILNKNFRNLGVGFTYIKDSDYKTYITQLFYR
ncbi:CAP domain-containing protein [Herbinix luporum]|jgi:uncharacterized protein YkwD|uniref:Uncharacterized protein n=1 Tax=Herbinix luporum TaxID=1679721 RepID=A0A0K8J2B1_9FIRM|nr:CAP domain-containing protein [Herbinix luporum]MDI9489523.1 CAP domain-containing protein [Bacillota bacterium]CUH91595.1 hypothetical protein SD1D_0032 [Herbinix luporum]HHT56403.1 hypothetical protein [Herbinix luporum]